MWRIALLLLLHNYVFEYLDKFKCFACKKIHYVPNIGFPSNDNLKELLKVNSAELSKEATIIKLKLESVQQNLVRANFSLTNAECLIKSHCNELKTQLRLFKALEIKKKDQLIEKIVCKIDDFEKLKLEAHLEAKNKDSDQFSLKLIEISEKFIKWNISLEH